MDGARLTPVSSHGGFGHEGIDPLLGQTLAGRYKIVRKIGEGGMGIVYEAVHVMIEKRVALKILREDFSHREDVVERFRQEAKSASRIGHEHIVDISDFGITPGGAHFFVMEFLQGNDLADELELRGPLPTRRAIEIVHQCAKALGAAHIKGIVHRDMKPENIFLLARDTGEDFVKIVDFGIAKMSEIDEHGASTPGRRLTRTGMIFGTPEYMSPEHAAGKELDHRVDIYALGIILYELLTGRVPFLGDTFMGILSQHMFEPLPPLVAVNPSCSAPPELERLIQRAVAKSADDRPQSMDELAQELICVRDQATSPLSSSLPPPGTITHVERQPPFAPTAASSHPPRLEPPRPPAMFLDEPTRAPSARTPLLLLALGVLLMMGVAVMMVVQRKKTPVAPVLPVVAEPLPAIVPEPVRAEAPPSAEVTVEVLTEPAGASVEAEGRALCAPTPCRFQAARGTMLKLAVQKAGYKPGATELTPERDLNQVQLTLAKKREHSKGNRMEGDLMLPDAFGNR
ncbi:MAG TPA: serine/threonine-protein kinase [Polyangiales bacterium]|nr:serine/threonine-protein kinase [Polyangiales bacterium]